ncbi:ribosomal protein S18-alanine N-acetyltransferase [Polynucleobacter paneuropaeus]|jgi:ribosomal-protein-alanine N-acetyltransferase|uniref:[Ribosomal protein bS18]-alanine N-acetyltransferase n=1 Tax=Polynucleobacter paneuropaeus TaxID=2527775 RepID=A0AAE3CGT4_9BURK|nr:ribosomal protein S18-alanine N-acetyltransferase [Polynucleobacter paneuropaeus]AWW47997.1 ribosomal-protein-alanine N-acetyltransferase [Polynucleobacter paneuropaeus]MBT8518277.1 ribosomal protein S18-alanine N-acetyltransferase [Polynucleobacter paneuropaeus]MBT8520951.1 ribosomal protein S18-alanine N-acetyltransferase [Polynucleobacter paneuropaeus]MBT8531444.1 ribosomal protein S18-alanine N-acetyltransferase [Polynucleobacter paneuropaeus]MBT8538405.1 ribosomal protein S18-alanine N
MADAAELAFLPMQSGDLDAVLSIEQISHTHPWTKGNFNDSLAAGHWAYCIRPEPRDAEPGSYLDPKVLWAYCVLYPAVDELHLLNITVAPKLRRLGIAARIMRAIEGIAASRQMPRIILEVRPSNIPAITLYESLGYEKIGVRKDYYPADQASGQREDAQVMAKSINLSA